MTMQDTPYVVIHGGVHKTATSYLQSILRRNAGMLKKKGVHYVHHRKTRKEFTIPTQLNGYEKIGLNYKTKISDTDLRKLTKAFFSDVNAKSGERIILSDENLAGHCGHCVRSGTLYNRRNVLIPIFANEIPYPVREVHVCVRNYADFFASAYIEFLRSASGERIISEQRMKQRVLSRLPSWLGLVRELRSAFPDARIVVWKFEDFRELSDTIIRNLCGPELEDKQLKTPKKMKIRPSASGKAIEELWRLINSIGAEAALKQRVEIQEKYPRGKEFSNYDPWTSQERAHLGRLYEKDWTELKSNPEYSVLVPNAVAHQS